MRPWIKFIAVVAAAFGAYWTYAIAPPAPKEPPPVKRVIVDSSLARHIGVVSAIGPKEILYFDGEGRPRTIQRDDVLVILPDTSSPAASAEDPTPLASSDPALDLVELASGELIPGQWSTSKLTSETIDWKSPLLGDLTLKLDDIRYIQGMREYVAFHTSAGRLLSLNSLKSLEEELPPERFIRIHKSYIVSIDKIDTLEGNLVHVGKEKLPTGANYREAVVRRVF